MSELRNILTDSVNGLFGDRVTRELLTRFDGTGDDGGIWAEVEAQGLTRPLVSEENGGVGGEWRDAHVLLSAAGFHSAPVPLAETILATWLAERAGLQVPEGMATIIDGSDGSLSDARDISASQNMAREPRDDVSFDGAPVRVAHLPNDLPQDVILQYGAMVRAAQIAGAMDRVLTQTVQYANERTQFGKPLGKFQAIQQELSRMAGEAAASGVIAEAPFAALDAGQNPEWQIAAAKARTSEAAGVGATVGHQTHGAIGFTYEHSLHFATRRLWSWRSEFGGARFWARRLGNRAVDRGVENFWADIVSG